MCPTEPIFSKFFMLPSPIYIFIQRRSLWYGIVCSFHLKRRIRNQALCVIRFVLVSRKLRLETLRRPPGIQIGAQGAPATWTFLDPSYQKLLTLPFQKLSPLNYPLQRNNPFAPNPPLQDPPRPLSSTTLLRNNSFLAACGDINVRQIFLMSVFFSRISTAGF